MYVVGIDIGSTATKAVALDEGKNIIGTAIIPKPPGTTGEQEAFDQLCVNAGKDPAECAYSVATGYGRLISQKADMQYSEISCHAKGLHSMLPQARTIIDFGGQDLKAIQLTERGSVQQFLMNDKCAAGTGRFLEMMSTVLGVHIDELGSVHDRSTREVSISSTCAVFAESEVISLMSSGCETADIVAGVHDSVARKMVALVKRIGVIPEVAMTGGGALNSGLVKALRKILGREILIPEYPQYAGALGAALYAWEKSVPKE